MNMPAQWIERARSVPIESIIEQRSIRLRGKAERVGPCPRCGGHDRFGVNIKKQVFNCRGCKAGGGVIEFIKFLDGCEFVDACKTLAGQLPIGASFGNQAGAKKLLNTQPETQEYERKQKAKARYLYRSSKPAIGTPVETYLRVRGITASLPSTVRFLPPHKAGQHPAMVVPYGFAGEPSPGILDIATDAITAIQMTLLSPDGSGKAAIEPNKLTIASPAGMPMVLAPMNDLMGLAVCEGVEDALSGYQATGLGAWACGGAIFMPKLVAAVQKASPECITIYAHDDEAGGRGAGELAKALVARGFEVFLEGAGP